jgi:hypothetical protein
MIIRIRPSQYYVVQVRSVETVMPRLAVTIAGLAVIGHRC